MLTWKLVSSLVAVAVGGGNVGAYLGDSSGNGVAHVVIGLVLAACGAAGILTRKAN